jgi:hypothetical protein
MFFGLEVNIIMKTCNAVKNCTECSCQCQMGGTEVFAMLQTEQVEEGG